MEKFFLFLVYFFEIFFTELYILKHAGVNKKIKYIIPFSYCIILSLNIGSFITTNDWERSVARHSNNFLRKYWNSMSEAESERAVYIRVAHVCAKCVWNFNENRWRSTENFWTMWQHDGSRESGQKDTQTTGTFSIIYMWVQQTW